MNEQQLLADWALHFAAVGGVPLRSDIAERMLAGWREQHRAYHTPQHLGECLELLNRWAGGREDRHVVASALWFHDFIYDTQAPDSEDRSIAAAREMLSAEGVRVSVIDQVAQLIEVTKHGAVAAQTDAERLMVDIDLAILGASPARFREFCDQVRSEYAWVPEVTYNDRRAEFLQQMLARPHIYETEGGRAELEARTRANLAEEVRRLRAA